MPGKTIGQVAFEEWQSRVPQGPFFEWNKLPLAAQVAWEEVALAVVNRQNEIERLYG